MTTYLLIAVMYGWRGPAEYRGLNRATADALREFFQSIGAFVAVIAE
jgi:hypothetical protein